MVDLLDDRTFLAAFEACAIPNHAFRHREHVRMAWLYLRRDGAEQGEQKVVDGIQRFAAAHGATQLYNDTLTRFWARLIQHHIDLDASLADFNAFITRYPRLLDSGLAFRHYSRDLLFSEPARRQWLDPDLRPFPGA
jgi:hypothetical protein